MQHIIHGTPDSRKWRIVHAAHPCKVCGLTPIAARSAAGWTLRCRQDASHGYQFDQWLKECVRKWDTHNPKPSRIVAAANTETWDLAASPIQPSPIHRIYPAPEN